MQLLVKVSRHGLVHPGPRVFSDGQCSELDKLVEVNVAELVPYKNEKTECKC